MSSQPGSSEPSSAQASPESNQTNPNQTAASSVSELSQHPQSCLLCAQRKVKCDRRLPSCANCLKAKHDCEYRAPLPRGPRKRKQLNAADEDPMALADKLAKCEDLLRSLGISPDNVEAGRAYTAPSHKQKADNEAGLLFPRGRLMAEEGRLRYVENTLWATVADEVPDHESSTTDIQREADFTSCDNAQSKNLFSNAAGSMMFGLPFLAGRTQSTNLAVPREHALILWTIFEERVQPLSHIVHGPTTVKKHNVFLNRPDDLPKRTQALLAGIYYSALNSLSDAECQSHFGKSRRDMFQTYFPITAEALVEARFLATIDIETLQGLVFFVMASRDKLDARTVWSLIGVAIRIGQYIGLHHDGDDLKLSPFEAEMRRRLWWQIGILEAAIGELSGFGPSTMVTSSKTKPPSNLNDEDIHPDMKFLPPSRIGATDMMFVMLRTTAGHMARKHRIGSLFMGNWMRNSQSGGPTKILLKLIAEMEEIVEKDFIRYCDYLNPLHKLCSSMARTFMCRLRLKMNHPIAKVGGRGATTDEEKQSAFENALKIIQYDNFVLSDETLAKFRWHTIVHFQWDSLLFLFRELRLRDVFDKTSEQAWEAIEQSFANHPELVEDPSKLLHVAVEQMCLKAWAIREEVLRKRHPCDPVLSPKFIANLREREAERQRSHQRKLDTQRQPPGIPARAAPEQPLANGVGVDVGGPPVETFGYMPSLSEGTMLNSAMDGVMDLNFNFGMTEDFNFTFDVPQEFPLGASQPEADWTLDPKAWGGWSNAAFEGRGSG